MIKNKLFKLDIFYIEYLKMYKCVKMDENVILNIYYMYVIFCSIIRKI